MMATDLKRRLFSVEVASLLSWSRREAREWLKVNGKREGKRYHITVAELFRHRPELREDEALVEDRLTLAGDIKRMLHRIDDLHMRLAKVESAERRTRRMAQRFAALIRSAKYRNKKASVSRVTHP